MLRKKRIANRTKLTGRTLFLCMAAIVAIRSQVNGWSRHKRHGLCLYRPGLSLPRLLTAHSAATSAEITVGCEKITGLHSGWPKIKLDLPIAWQYKCPVVEKLRFREGLLAWNVRLLSRLSLDQL